MLLLKEIKPEIRNKVQNIGKMMIFHIIIAHICAMFILKATKGKQENRQIAYESYEFIVEITMNDMIDILQILKYTECNNFNTRLERQGWEDHPPRRRRRHRNVGKQTAHRFAGAAAAGDA